MTRTITLLMPVLSIAVGMPMLAKPQVQLAAATALGTLEEPRALEPLVTALKDRDLSVRCASVAALGKLGDPRAVEPLTALLQDENDYVRREAAAALKQIAKPKPTPEPTTQPPEPAPPELNVATHFKLILRFNPAYGTRPDKFPTIEFSTEPMLPKPYPPGYWFVQITPPQTTKLYDHLKQTGFFNRRERDPKKEAKPSYFMRSSGPLGSHFEYLGWGPPLIKRLTGLRKVLDEESAKPVDQLLGALSKGDDTRRTSSPPSRNEEADVPKDSRGLDATSQQADVDALLAKVRDVLPEGWEATLYWNPEDPEFTPLRVGSLDEKWRSWLPGIDGRRIEIRRKKAVHFEREFSGSDPAGDYAEQVTEYLRFALTLGDARQKEEIHRRLAELENMIKRLEIVLKPSFHRQEKDGYVRHTLPRDDKGRRAYQEYDLLWTIKRWFPQWSLGNISVGFRSLVWLRFLPEDAKMEYRQVKEKVLSTLRPVPGWKYIPADEE